MKMKVSETGGSYRHIETGTQSLQPISADKNLQKCCLLQVAQHGPGFTHIRLGIQGKKHEEFCRGEVMCTEKQQW